MCFEAPSTPSVTQFRLIRSKKPSAPATGEGSFPRVGVGGGVADEGDLVPLRFAPHPDDLRRHLNAQEPARAAPVGRRAGTPAVLAGGLVARSCFKRASLFTLVHSMRNGEQE